MNEILSNEEIDTLLDMFRSEEAELTSGDGAEISLASAKGEEGPLVSPVDLLKPNRLSREQLLSLERHFESSAKRLSATISDKLRLDTRCDCVAVEQVRFQTWLQHLPGPVAIYVLEMEPLKWPFSSLRRPVSSTAQWTASSAGPGGVARVPSDFSSAEYTVADAMVGPCLDRICESLAEVIPLQWKVDSRFCNPSMAQIIPSQDVVLSVYFQAAGDFLLGDLRMVIPFVAIEPFLTELGRNAATMLEPGSMRDTMQGTLRRVPVDFKVRLGDAKIPLRQLLSLRTGDVVPVDTRVGELLPAPVQGRNKFLGQVGTRGNRLAYQVLKVTES